MSGKVVAIGCDHAGFPYKHAVLNFLKQAGYEVSDFGTHSPESVDYPDFIHPVADAVQSGAAAVGIIMCGSGNGASMTANKHQGVRAAVCWNNELASLAREHNDANILSIPVRYVNEATALSMVQTFLDTGFAGGRHARRVNKIDQQ